MSRRRAFLRLILAAVALGALNQFFLKPHFAEAIPFLAWYANDVIAGFFLLAFTQYLLARTGHPPLSMGGAFLLTLAAGAAWELLPYLWKPAGVADPWDLLAYQSGALLCHLLSPRSS